jgi:hypothetical protein
MSFIENLQNKSRFIRIQILWISVILIMSIIFFFWLIYLNSSLESLGSSQELQPQIQERQSIPSLFGTLKEDISLFKKSLQAGIKEVMEAGEEGADFEVEIIKPKRLPE